MKTNRYIVALAGVMLHLMIGSVYAWSVYTKPIAAQTGWSESSVAFAFSANFSGFYNSMSKKPTITAFFEV